MKFSLTSCVFLIALILSSQALLGYQNSQLPVPSPVKEKEILKQIRQLFSKEYASSRPGTSALILELSDVANGSQDPAEKYVLLEEVLRLSCEAGDVSNALNTFDKLANSYALRDEQTMRARLIQSMAKKIPDSYSGHRLLRFGYGSFENQLKNDNFDQANKQLSQLSKLARKGKFTSWQALFAKSKKHLKDVERAHRALLKKLESQNVDPYSPISSLELANYNLEKKDDFAQALSFFAKCKGHQIAQLAQRFETLDDRTSNTDRIAIADSCYRIGLENETLLSPFEVAFDQYQIALPKTTGLEKKRVQERIRELKNRLIQVTDVTEFYGRTWTVKWKNGHPTWAKCFFDSHLSVNVATVNGKERKLPAKFLNGAMLCGRQTSEFTYAAIFVAGAIEFQKINRQTGKVVDHFRPATK